MPALGWLLNLGFAGSGTVVTIGGIKSKVEIYPAVAKPEATKQDVMFPATQSDPRIIK